MARRSAFFLVACVTLLTALGFAMLMSTGGFSVETAKDEWAGLRRQGAWLGIGLVACWTMMRVDYHRLQKFAWPLFWICCGLLALCFVPHVGVARYGAARWISIGGVQGQPSELARIGVVVALAAWCARFREKRSTLTWGFAYPLAVMLVPIGLIAAEVDLGSSVLIFSVCAIMLYLAGTRWIYILAMVVSGAALLYAGIFMGESRTAKNRQARVAAFLHLEDPQFARDYPEIDELNTQQREGIYAFGTGGITGQGLGDGRQKQHYLPMCHTDFIFPVIGEELGVIATLSVVGLLLGFTLSGLLISVHAPDRFGKLLGSGLVLLLVVQALINMGVSTGCMPNKGMPLPFISYGGSNLCCALVSVGILLNIYRQGRPVTLASDPVLSSPKLSPAV